VRLGSAETCFIPIRALYFSAPEVLLLGMYSTPSCTALIRLLALEKLLSAAVSVDYEFCTLAKVGVIRFMAWDQACEMLRNEGQLI